MPDLLTHTLVAFTLGSALSWRIGWVVRPYVTAVMVGAILPDLVKIKLLLPSAEVAATLGLPFSWLPLHTLLGAMLSVATVGALVASRAARRRTLVTVGAGVLSHLILDGFLRTPTGRGGPIFWPITEYQPPTPGLYLSTDPWPAVLCLCLAVATATINRRHLAD